MINTENEAPSEVTTDEPDVIERLLIRLEMLRRVLKDGHLDRELPEGPNGGARA